MLSGPSSVEAAIGILGAQADDTLLERLRQSDIASQCRNGGGLFTLQEHVAEFHNLLVQMQEVEQEAAKCAANAGQISLSPQQECSSEKPSPAAVLHLMKSVAGAYQKEAALKQSLLQSLQMHTLSETAMQTQISQSLGRPKLADTTSNCPRYTACGAGYKTSSAFLESVPAHRAVFRSPDCAHCLPLQTTSPALQHRTGREH
eukprot:6179990-Pleurochrysis_carterae.AAC.1